MLFVILSNGVFDWFRLSQLYSLGLQTKHLYFGLIFIGVIFGYLLLKPMITWFIILESARMLSYLISSLIVILAFFIVVLFNGELPGRMLGLLKLTLQCLALWGVAIVLYSGFRLLFNKKN